MDPNIHNTNNNTIVSPDNAPLIIPQPIASPANYVPVSRLNATQGIPKEKTIQINTSKINN